jgi:hypothetical protein
MINAHDAIHPADDLWGRSAGDYLRILDWRIWM